jgi:hypothetical protein
MNALSDWRWPPVVAGLKCRSPADLELSADVRTIFVGRTVA